jgi:hypothetical protein
MTLPTSRNTTYAAGSQVKSADLNDLQDQIIALAAGTIGPVKWAVDISPAALGSDQNDWNPTSLSTAQVIRASASTSGIDLTGLSGGADGRLLALVNVGTTYTLTLKDENASSSAANRFALGGYDLAINPTGAAILIYDATSSRWRVLARHKANATRVRRVNLVAARYSTSGSLIVDDGGDVQIFPPANTDLVYCPIPVSDDEIVTAVRFRGAAAPDNGTDDMTLKVYRQVDGTGTQLGSTQTSASSAGAAFDLTVSGLTEDPSSYPDAVYNAVIGFSGTWGGTGAGNLYGLFVTTVPKL